jgi:hypothetical protein
MTKTSVASTPVKAGEAPVNTVPALNFNEARDAATKSLSAVMKGGSVCVTFIASALLVGYLQQTAMKVKMDVIRDEFMLALKKKGLGGTQAKKYMSVANKIAVAMFKECSYGMEMAALIAANTPDKAHDAVTGFIARHTKGKKTEHGFKLDDALDRLNVLMIYLGMEPDPAKPEKLGETTTDAQKQDKRRTNAAKAIEKDAGILSKVNAEKLVDTVASVVTFDKLVTAHVNKMTDAKKILAELKAIEAAYKSRIKSLTADMGKAKAKAEKPAEPVTSQEAAAA